MADVTITPANVVPATQNTRYQGGSNFVTGEAIAAGEGVCIFADAGVQKYYKADANNADRVNYIGVAGNSAPAGGQRLDVVSAATFAAPFVVGTHGVALGTPLFVSNNAGKFCPYADLTAGSFVILAGWAATTTGLQLTSEAKGGIARAA